MSCKYAKCDLGNKSDKEAFTVNPMDWPSDIVGLVAPGSTKDKQKAKNRTSSICCCCCICFMVAFGACMQP